jgi:hypothetical protein
MDKKVWAIAGVFCLQLGATWFFGGGLQSEEVAESVPPSQTYTAHILRNIYSRRAPEVVEPTETQGPETVAEAAVPQTVRARRLVKATRPKPIQASYIKPKPLPVFTAAQEPPRFTDTVIVVKRANYAVNERASLKLVEPKPVVAMAEIKPNKKAFLSRAVKVIKKPYDLIKAMVSKL